MSKWKNSIDKTNKMASAGSVSTRVRRGGQAAPSSGNVSSDTEQPQPQAAS